MTEIERLRQWELVGREWIDKTDWMQSRDAPVRWLGKHRADALREEIERLRAERDELRRKLDEMRAALIAAVEIAQKERVRIAYNAKGAPPAIEIGYADILRRLGAVIAQADAALK